MKIELEWDETSFRLLRLYPPDGIETHPHHRLTCWRAWGKQVLADGGLSPSWFGDGATPQLAINACIAALPDAIARLSQPRYNVNTGPKSGPLPDLDLSFLGTL